MRTFAALIRNDSKAGGVEDNCYSRVVCVDANNEKDAHFEIDSYARAKGYKLETIHPIGLPIFAVEKIHSSFFNRLSKAMEALSKPFSKSSRDPQNPLAGE